MAKRMCRYAPITDIHVERVAFDTQSISADRPLSGAEHRQGPLAGTEARSYLHAKWGRACAYCGATGIPLNIDHLWPRSRGGSDRITNLVLACIPCNQAKGCTPVDTFLERRPDRLARILRQVKTPLRDAAAMNTTRWRLVEVLSTLGKPVHTWSGNRTKWNRTAMGLPKTHTLDALSVGHLDHGSGDAIVRFPERFLAAKATGRGSYARTTPDRFGFPGSVGHVRSSTSDTSPETSYVPLSRRASGPAYGPAGYPSGPPAATASPPGSAESTFPTAISNSFSGPMAMPTPPSTRLRHRHLRKPVDPYSIGS